MKGRRIIIPAVHQDKALKQLHLNHIGIEETRLLACRSIHWMNMNGDIEEIAKKKLPHLPGHSNNTTKRKCHMKYH